MNVGVDCQGLAGSLASATRCVGPAEQSAAKYFATVKLHKLKCISKGSNCGKHADLV